MSLWMNIIFAWIALILTFLLVVIWGLRLIVKNKPSRRNLAASIRPCDDMFSGSGDTDAAAKDTSWLKRVAAVNRCLRRHHKLTGILLIATGAVHGLFSSDTLWSLNLGTVTWLVSILLGISWMLRKKLKKAWMTAHRLLVAAFTALLVIHILNVGGFILDDMIAGRFTETRGDTEIMGTAEGAYLDGTYYGTGTGYRPGLVVEVIIEGGQIVSVQVVEHDERDQRYWGYPVIAIPEAIIAAQSTDVDNISGATMTCDGIKEAVADAMSQALTDRP
jgi:uncharacterized protein with FMN-binding domain